VYKLIYDGNLSLKFQDGFPAQTTAPAACLAFSVFSVEIFPGNVFTSKKSIIISFFHTR
jgi:hypothetical protein